jgi:phage terminase small subunit
MDKLTKKQRGFVKDYLDTDNATEAAERNYDVKNRNVANAIGAENLAKPSIQQVIESHAEKAESMIYHLSQNGEREAIRLGASKDIMNRAGYKAVDKSMNINLDANITINPETLKVANEFEERLKKQL